MKRTFAIFISVVLLLACAAGQSSEAIKKLKQAQREMDSPRANPDHVEKLIRESLKASPDYLEAQRALADLYATLHRYDNAAEEFKKALALDDAQHKLSRNERDALLDSIGLMQALGRHFDDAIATYKAALGEHAEYALFEYNLACSYAEKGDLDSALLHLKKAWELKDTMPRGQNFPDPRKDESFRKFWGDSRFQKTVENMVV